MMPLVNRAVVGGAAWVSIAQFFVVEELVRRSWTLPYSRSADYISDLGAVTCGTYKGRQVCSPDHAAMNASFVVLGVAVVVGAALLGTAARELLTAPGLGLYAAAGVGCALVGLFPEDAGGSIHPIGAALFFVGASLGHVLLGWRLRELGIRWYGGALALVGMAGLIGTVLVAVGADLGVGRGFVQRVVVYGADLGFIATGVLMIRGLGRRSWTTGRISPS